MAVQSSSSDVIMAMKTVQTYLYQVGCPILIVIGTVGCLINLGVFTQKTLRKNPCSIYFIAYNIANFIYIYSSLLPLTLIVGYDINAGATNLVICRLRLYIVALSNLLSSFYLVLAAVDRIFITSRNARIRRQSTRRLAYICIAIGSSIPVLFHVHLLIFSTITQLGPNTFLCYYQQGVQLTFMGYYAIIKELTAQLSLSIFGLWSIKNIRSTRRVGVVVDSSVTRTAVEHSTSSSSSKDRQLLLMLFMDIVIYALFSFVFAIFLLYQQITQNQVKSPDRLQIETIVRNITLFSAGIPFCLCCYTNLLMSKAFRSEVKKLLSCTH